MCYQPSLYFPWKRIVPPTRIAKVHWIRINSSCSRITSKDPWRVNMNSVTYNLFFINISETMFDSKHWHDRRIYQIHEKSTILTNKMTRTKEVHAFFNKRIAFSAPKELLAYLNHKLHYLLSKEHHLYWYLFSMSFKESWMKLYRGKETIIQKLVKRLVDHHISIHINPSFGINGIMPNVIGSKRPLTVFYGFLHPRHWVNVKIIFAPALNFVVRHNLSPAINAFCYRRSLFTPS